MTEDKKDAKDLVERMRSNTRKQNRHTRAKPLKRVRGKVPKDRPKKAEPGPNG